MERYKVVDSWHVTGGGIHSEPQAKVIEDFLNHQADEGWAYRDALMIGGSKTYFILEKSTFARIVETAKQSKAKT